MIIILIFLLEKESINPSDLCHVMTHTAVT